MSRLAMCATSPVSRLIVTLPEVMPCVDTRLPSTFTTVAFEPSVSSTTAPHSIRPKSSTSSPLSVPAFSTTLAVCEGSSSLLIPQSLGQQQSDIVDGGNHEDAEDYQQSLALRP